MFTQVLDKKLSEIKKIHMIGIGGSGMCPLAEILHSKGYTVTGSDNNVGDPLRRVQKLGIKTYLGHSAENLSDTEMVVYSAAISKDNPELCEAQRQGIPTVERAQMLGWLTSKYSNCIGVCGTHGKTTVSSIITQILFMNDIDPTAVIGGFLPIIAANGRAGKSDYMVCEACEYVDTFLKLSPDIAVLLNIDNDHLEYFKTMENLTNSFRKFISMASVCFINGDDELCKRAAEGIDAKVITFGIKDECDYTAKNIRPSKRGMEFDIFFKEQCLGKVTLNIPGEHNVYNALAAFCVAHHIGIDPQKIIEATESFSGAGRRFEYLGEYRGITVADDYAHHPTEIEATLLAAKQLNYDSVTVIFQPFTFSRTALLKEDFIKALSIADKIILTPIMGSREKNIYGITSEELALEIHDSIVIQSFEEVADYIAQNTKSGELVLTMGGGDIYKAAHLIIEKLS